jgi:hypothetical protein
MIRKPKKIFDPYRARWSYERLLILQPQANIMGLWEKEGIFYVVSQDWKNKVGDKGETLLDWFKSNSALASPIVGVFDVPEGATPVPTRTIQELSDLSSEPLTAYNLYAELAIRLRSKFPKFEIKEDLPDKLLFYVEKELTAQEYYNLTVAYERFGYNLKLEIVISPERFSKPIIALPKRREGDINLLPSRQLPETFSKLVRGAWEEDEDFWSDNRQILLTTNRNDASLFLPNTFMGEDGSSCIVGASGLPPENIRNYLTIHNKVVLRLPLQNETDNWNKQLGITKKELYELTKLGRVQFLCPFSIDRYDVSLIDEILSIAPQCILFSRRLASATVADTRRRFPLLYPPFSTEERYQLLHALHSINHKEGLSEIIIGFSGELGRIWDSADHKLQFVASNITSTLGIGALAASIFKTVTGKDHFIEFASASAGVEWGGALKATVYPYHSHSYSEMPTTEIIASLSSGFPSESPNICTFEKLDILTSGLLTLNNDAPVLEVAEIFNGHDQLRLRLLFKDIREKNKDIGSITEAVRKFNNKVLRYERNMTRLQNNDTYGLAKAMLSDAIPFSGSGEWLLNRTDLVDLVRTKVSPQVLDWLEAVNAWTSGDVVLVNRLKRELNK